MRLPDQKTLRELIYYDATTGLIYWRAREPKHFFATKQLSALDRCNMWNGRCAGKRAFKVVGSRGHFKGTLLGHSFLAHRVVWKWLHGTEPETIDHIDGNPANNMADNLRAATAGDQARNQSTPKTNRSGHVGVTVTKSGTWKAQIGGGGTTRYLGCFASKSEAIAARKAAERDMGYHENHGRTNLLTDHMENRA